MGMSGADLLGLIGIVVGVLGIAAAIGAGWWFGRGPRVVTQVSGATLVSVPDNELIKLTYDGHGVKRITQSQVWIWREGRGTVKGSDVSSADPVTLRVPEGFRILDVSVLKQSKTTNKVEVARDETDKTKATVTFDYLDPRQGAVIEVTHTGERPEVVVLGGTIMGIPKGITPVGSGATVVLAMGLAGDAAVTIPTHSIPRSLRIADQSKKRESVFSGGAGDAVERVLRVIAASLLP
jgi:hypothetical protein